MRETGRVGLRRLNYYLMLAAGLNSSSENLTEVLSARPAPNPGEDSNWRLQCGLKH